MWTDDFLNAQRLIADPPADEAVEKVLAEKGPDEAKRLFDLLITRLELPENEFPESIKEFIKTHRQPPAFANPQLILQGEKFFQAHGPSMVLNLFYKSLPLIYTHKYVSKVLVRTGRLSHKPGSDAEFSRRIAETGQFLLDVMQPGGLAAGGQGIETALRVRLIHASIRAFTSKGGWPTAQAGKPVNQEDLALTLMTFSVVLLDGLKQMGRNFSQEEEAAYFHCWNVVGHYIGLQPQMLPANPEQGRELLNVSLRRFAVESEEGRLLTAAIVKFSENALPEKIIDQAPSLMIRFLCGDQYADMLGVQVAHGCLGKFLPKMVRLWFGWVDRLEERNETIDKLSDRLSAALARGMVNYFNKEKNMQFRIPESLRKAWNL